MVARLLFRSFAIYFLLSPCGCAWAETACKWPGAAYLSPGNAVFPGKISPAADPGTPAAKPLTSRFSITTTAGTTTGTVVSSVYVKDGTMDFYYQVSNDASSAFPLIAVETTSFAYYKTCVAFRTDGASLPGFQNGTNPPITATSSSPPPAGGFEIGFQFYPPEAPPAEIPPGATSTVFIISTDATHLSAQGATIILDQAAGAMAPGYEPMR